MCSNGKHNNQYLHCWTEFYDRSSEIQKFFVKKMGVSCDCQALEIGRKKMSKIENGEKFNEKVATS
ncbi:MAG: hypothetical protein ACFFD1_02130 [Candidatus Thorarchaeota archaeon]